MDRKYLMRGLSDNVLGVAYRTGPKGRIDHVKIPMYFNERRIIRSLTDARKRILYLDNCGEHKKAFDIIDAIESKNTEVRFFPKNATHLSQPCDFVAIQKIGSDGSIVGNLIR